MANGIRWHGLSDLRDELRDLAVNLTLAASPVVKSAAEDAVAAMQAQYPRGKTGRLRESVYAYAVPKGPTASKMRIINTAPYAHYFEYGTRYMAPGRVFIPNAIRYRRVLYRDLSADVLPRFNLRAKGSFP